MKFACDQCQTRYSIADDRVRGRILKVRCKHCGNVVTVKEAVALKETGSHRVFAAEPNPFDRADKTQISSAIPTGLTEAHVPSATAVDATAEPAAHWYLSFDGAQEGPFSNEQVIARLKQERARQQDAFCWRAGFQEWLPVAQVAEFARSLRSTPPPIPTSEVSRSSPSKASASGLLPAPAPMGGTASPARISAIGAATLSRPSAQTQAVPVATTPKVDLGLARAALPEVAPKVGAARPQVQSPPIVSGNANDENEFLIGEASGLINLSMLAQATQTPAAPTLPVEAPIQAIALQLAAPRGVTAAVAGAALHQKSSPFWMKWVAAGAVVAAVALAGVLIYVLRRPTPIQERVEVRRQLENAPILFRDAPESIVIAGHSDGKIAAVGVKRAPVINHPGPVEAKPGVKANSRESRLASLYADSKDRDLSVPGRTGGSSVGQPVSQQAIINAITQNRRSLNACYERVLKHDDSLKRAKIIARVNIGLSGTVTKVTILDAQYARAEIGQCLVHAIRSWHFPASGEEYETELPIHLQAN